jgi:hypothetical protein
MAESNFAREPDAIQRPVKAYRRVGGCDGGVVGPVSDRHDRNGAVAVCVQKPVRRIGTVGPPDAAITVDSLEPRSVAGRKVT